jgi:NitT/TauT family transport system substrate-binding protein
MGGPNTFLMVWTTKKFRDENPKSYKAILDALREATDSINADKRRAAELYVKEGGGKENVDKILALMSDPQVRYTLAPERVLPYAQFMHQIGTLKNNPDVLEGPLLPGHPRPARQLTGCRSIRRAPPGGHG